MWTLKWMTVSVKPLFTVMDSGYALNMICIKMQYLFPNSPVTSHNVSLSPACLENQPFSSIFDGFAAFCYFFWHYLGYRGNVRSENLNLLFIFGLVSCRAAHWSIPYPYSSFMPSRGLVEGWWYTARLDTSLCHWLSRQASLQSCGDQCSLRLGRTIFFNEHGLISTTAYWMTVIHIPFTQHNVTSIGIGNNMILKWTL